MGATRVRWGVVVAWAIWIATADLWFLHRTHATASIFSSATGLLVFAIAWRSDIRGGSR